MIVAPFLFAWILFFVFFTVFVVYKQRNKISEYFGSVKDKKNKHKFEMLDLTPGLFIKIIISLIFFIVPLIIFFVAKGIIKNIDNTTALNQTSSSINNVLSLTSTNLSVIGGMVFFVAIIMPIYYIYKTFNDDF